jgi:hypothetical protein
MRIGSFVSLLGFILIIAGTFSPLLRPFGLFSWDVYHLNKPFGIVMLVIAIAGALGCVLQSHSLAKVAAIISLLLVVLLYAAALSKVNTSFSFIPFKGLSAGLTHLIKFKWGWYVLFIGGVIAVVGGIANRPPKNITNPSETIPV